VVPLALVKHVVRFDFRGLLSCDRLQGENHFNE
jgi:hypothetical protein